MKRVGNVYEKITNLENLKQAFYQAKKGKGYREEIERIEENLDFYLLKLQKSLTEKTFSTSKYRVDIINDKGKERTIHKLPFYPDRIVHWAIMLQTEDIFTQVFIRNTFGSIKNRGVHDGLSRVKKDLRNYPSETIYCLKLDIKKFFPNINQEILSQLYRKKIKDKDLLWLLDNITFSIDGGKGIAIGNYISQYTSNFYLAYFDHWLKEKKGVRFMYRYMDDIVILHSNKDFLHQLRKDIQIYLKEELDLELKENYQVFPVDVRGIDFLGYRIFRDYVLLRKSTKVRFIKQMQEINKNEELIFSQFCSINSYKGWLKHGNCRNLEKKYIRPLQPKLNQYKRNQRLKKKAGD